MRYEYPASSHIQNFAPFDSDSHFYADGQADFGELKVNCSFEVAYTHNCEIIVVLYLDHHDWLELFSHKREVSGQTAYDFGGSIPHTHFNKITGIDSRFELEVIVEDGFLRQVGGLESPTIFVANYLYRIDRRSIVIDNFPYKKCYVFELTGVDFNTDMVHTRTFPIREDGLSLTLEVIYGRKRQYDNQPLVRLLVPEQAVSETWTPEIIADMWCALVSLAIGRDVRWTTIEYAREGQVEAKWLYRNNVLGMKNFKGLIAQYPLEFDSESTIEFIRRCFMPIQKSTLTSSLVLQYVQAIRHYVTYRLLDHRQEDTSRLIATTVEELLSTWEEARKLEPETITSEDEISAILNATKEFVYPVIKNFASTKKDKIKKKIGYLIRKELPRFGFEDRLNRYFELSLQNMPPKWFEKNLNLRISHFVTTRDSVIHSGKFPAEEQKVDNWYYYNLLMILPLMIFVLFDYDGFYIDLTEYWKESLQAPETESTED